MDNSQLETVAQLLESAQTNIKTALSILAGQSAAGQIHVPKTRTASIIQSSTEEDEGKVVEGVFDGQTMIDAEGKKYPVPANYASKSKLIAGDILKLNVMNDGKFIYKQIGPVERKSVIGILTQDGGHFQVIANGKKFNVLLASVTYFKAKAGDEVTIIIPAKEETDWACIDNVLTGNPLMQ